MVQADHTETMKDLLNILQELPTYISEKFGIDFREEEEELYDPGIISSIHKK